MSMSEPLEPNPAALSGRDDEQTIPAADPGTGAPPTAAGFGVGGEEPDPGGEADAHPTGADPTDAQGGEPPFRTPDPAEIGRDAG